MQKESKTNKLMLDYIKTEIYINAEDFHDFILDTQGSRLDCQSVLKKTKHLRNVLDVVDTYATCAINVEREI
jgi:hypothetical protein